MVLPIAALMLGLGAKRGYDDSVRADEDRTRKLKQEDEDRAYMRSQRDRTLRQQADEDNLNASMKMAAAPGVVEPNMLPDPTSDNRDAGLPGTAPPVQDGYRVAGQVVGDRAAADAIAAQRNDPLATMRRQATVLQGAGKATDAMALRNQADQWEANDALKEAGKLMMTGGWKAVPEIYGRYKDGKGARVEEDGKGGATVISIDEATGKEIGRRQFKDLPHLFATIAGRFDPKLWVADEVRRGADAESSRRWEAEQGVREKNADSSAALRAAQADAATARADAATMRATAAARAAEPKPETPDSTFDEKTAADIAKDMVKREAEEMAVSGKQMTGAQVAKRVDEIVQSMRQTHVNRFVEGQVQRVLSTAQADPQAYAQEYGKALKLIPQARLAQMGFQPPASGRPPAVPVPAAAPATAAPAAAPAPPAAPAGDRVLAEIDAKNRAALDALAQQVVAAKQQLAAVTKSGDPQALATYAQQVTRATEALKAEAAKRLGNRAPAYLQTVL